MVVNSDKDIEKKGVRTFRIDADALAQKINNPKSINVIMLGFALAAASGFVPGPGSGQGSEPGETEHRFFCNMEDIKEVLEIRLADKKGMRDESIEALETGFFEQ